jgi:hypothetical protein
MAAQVSIGFQPTRGEPRPNVQRTFKRRGEQQNADVSAGASSSAEAAPGMAIKSWLNSRLCGNDDFRAGLYRADTNHLV